MNRIVIVGATAMFLGACASKDVQKSDEHKPASSADWACAPYSNAPDSCNQNPYCAYIPGQQTPSGCYARPDADSVGGSFCSALNASGPDKCGRDPYCYWVPTQYSPGNCVARNPDASPPPPQPYYPPAPEPYYPPAPQPYPPTYPQPNRPPRLRNCQNNDQGKLTVRGHSRGSKMLTCPSGQLRNSQSYTGTSAPCDWDLGASWAKLTCVNDGNRSLDADHTYIECCDQY